MYDRNCSRAAPKLKIAIIQAVGLPIASVFTMLNSFLKEKRGKAKYYFASLFQIGQVIFRNSYFNTFNKLNTQNSVYYKQGTVK